MAPCQVPMMTTAFEIIMSPEIITAISSVSLLAPLKANTSVMIRHGALCWPPLLSSRPLPPSLHFPHEHQRCAMDISYLSDLFDSLQEPYVDVIDSPAPATPPPSHETLAPAPAAPAAGVPSTERRVEPAHDLETAQTNTPPQRAVARRRTTRARKPSIASLRAQAKAYELIVTYLPYVLRDLDDTSPSTSTASEEHDPTITGDPEAQRICSSLKRMVVLSKETQEEIAKRTEYLRLLKRHLQGTADLRRLMRGLQLDSWFWMCDRWRSLARDYYVPYSTRRCYEIVQETLEAIRKHELPYGTKENEAFGWRDSVYLDADGYVRFATRKILPNTDMKQLVDHTWSVYSDGDSLKQSHHGDRCEMFHETLQEISPDLMIIQRVEKYPELVQLTHSLVIIFRVRTEKGYMIVSRCIESPQLQGLMKAEGLSICGVFMWDTFDIVDQDGEGDATQYSLTGWSGSDNPTYAKRWRNEILIALIRYESQLTHKPTLAIDLSTEEGG